MWLLDRFIPHPRKPGVPAVTLDYVRWASRHIRIPWFAIGGIDLQRIGAVLEQGPRICVVSAILKRAERYASLSGNSKTAYFRGRI